MLVSPEGYKFMALMGVLMLFIPLKNLLGQAVPLQGVVVKDSSQPIPFVNIWISGTPLGTSTNDDGEFEIKIPQSLLDKGNTLSLSCLGYHSSKLDLDSLLAATDVQIALQASVTRLSELVILTQKARKKNANRAKKIVKQAIGNIPRNYPKDPFTLNTFYRHYCSENHKYVRLIEAAVGVHSPKNKFLKKEIPDEQLGFEVRQLRRSFDFTENAKVFHPAISLNFLWANDITAYQYHNPIAGSLDHYDFSIVDTTNYDQLKVYEIDFEDHRPLESRPETWYQGKLYITRKRAAFVRAEIQERKQRASPGYSVDSRISKLVIYRPYLDKFFVDRLISDVDVLHLTTDSTRVTPDTLRHRAHIEMISNNIITEDPPVVGGAEPGKSELRKILYDSAFWDSYTVLKETALEAKIIKDLSEKISLQKQFKVFNTIDQGGISIIESAHFKRLLENYRGTPLYVVLWSNWGHLNHLDLQPVNYFKRMLKKDRVKLLLVAVENDHELWMDNRQYYGLNTDHIEHRRLDLGFDSEIARSYFNNVFPYFLSVDDNGNLLHRDPPLPNHDEVKPYLKALIQGHFQAQQ